MTPPTRISFIRHGEVDNPKRIIYGRLPRFSLSTTGFTDANRAADHLRREPLSAVYASPLLRTRQTARQIIHHHPTLKLRLSKNLLEVKTSLQGMEEDGLQEVDVYGNHSAEWEQPSDIHRRVQKFIAKVRRNHSGEHIAAATHGDVILFSMFWVLGIELTPSNKLNLGHSSPINEYPATGSITTLCFTTDAGEEIPTMEYVNTAKL